MKIEIPEEFMEKTEQTINVLGKYFVRTIKLNDTELLSDKTQRVGITTFFPSEKYTREAHTIRDIQKQHSELVIYTDKSRFVYRYINLPQIDGIYTRITDELITQSGILILKIESPENILWWHALPEVE